mgnify:CR=1 FL=1
MSTTNVETPRRATADRRPTSRLHPAATSPTTGLHYPHIEQKRPQNVKDDIVAERGYKTLKLKSEQVVDFAYRPGKCKKDHRIVALRKNISVERGDNVLFDEIRYFFYITNDMTLTADEVVAEARQRCNQENLIAQLKGGVAALHAPVNTLNANWAYMTMASIAWTLKAWSALLLPVSPRWADQHHQQRRRRLDREGANSVPTDRTRWLPVGCRDSSFARY